MIYCSPVHDCASTQASKGALSSECLHSASSGIDPHPAQRQVQCCSNALPFSTAVCSPPLCHHHILSTTCLNHNAWSYQCLRQRQVAADANAKSQPTPTATAHPTQFSPVPPASSSPPISPPALLAPHVLQKHCCRRVPPELGLPFPSMLSPSTAPPSLHQIFLEFRRNEPLSHASPQETGSSQGRTASQRAMHRRGGKA
jgi:hypothetical protein